MKKALLAVAVLYAAGALVAPYFVSKATEEQVRKNFDEMPTGLLAAQGIEISLTDYQRGYFSSDAKVHFKWADTYLDEVYYESDLDVHISHAPLSLSGLNTHIATTTQAAQPTGVVGEHLPKDWLMTQTKNTFFGNIKSHTELKEVTAKDDSSTTIFFKGAEIDYQAPRKNPEKADIKIAFSGADIKAEDGFATLSDFNLHAYNLDDRTATVDIDTLNFVFNDEKTGSKANIDIKDFNEKVSVTSEGLPSALGLSADQLTYNIAPEGKDRVSGEFKDFELLYGFLPEDEDYRLQITAKGKFKVNDLPAESERLIPDQMDVDISVAPFTADSVNAFSEGLMTNAIIGTLDQYTLQMLSKDLFDSNLFAQDLHANINIDLDKKDENMLNIAGEFVENIRSEEDQWAMEEDPQAIRRLLAGTHLKAQASKAFVGNSGLSFALLMSGVPQDKLYDDDGNLDAELNITPDAATLNGEPLPF
ncbi:YdgA family protein [Suttonella sp. R2A3]|uniref:DUF945 family protein n=1 Tax=Suttonella sp. R2A3 TaxID=2908648 RepID=UPI001F485821|nr:DUF945 family protein [Suttonella sp. R2A3]UJF23899.1 YdgA family protein [Suttonella sp. R2A3]